jgi:hypothetical protein
MANFNSFLTGKLPSVTVGFSVRYKVESIFNPGGYFDYDLNTLLSLDQCSNTYFYSLADR